MKKLIKLKTIEVVKEIEKEIELPAYFIYGAGKPSDGYGIYFNVVKVTDPESDAESIQGPFGFGHHFFTYSRSPWTPTEIVSNERFTQVDKSEWDLAVDMLIKELNK